MEAARALGGDQKANSYSSGSDIHFDYKLANRSDGKRCGQDTYHREISEPGNASRLWLMWQKDGRIPIRVGVNSGSLEKELVEKYHGVTAEGLVESALDKVKIIEDMGYDQLVISTNPRTF